MEFDAEKTKKAQALYEFLHDYMLISDKAFDAKYPEYSKSVNIEHNADIMDYIRVNYY